MKPLATIALRRGGERTAAIDDRPLGHRAILRALPYALQRRFDPSAAQGLDAVLELRIRDPRGRPPARFGLRISGGVCEVLRGGAPNASAAAEFDAGDMIRLVTGAVGWPELLAGGRLEMVGDPFIALRFPKLFRLPASAA